MTKKDPYKDSPYDASGMPLGADTVDYDVKEDVAAKTVFDKPVETISLVDMDYTPRPIDEKLLPKKLKKSDFNSAIEEEVNTPEDPKTVDFEEITLENDDPKAIKKAVDEGDASFLDEDKKEEK